MSWWEFRGFWGDFAKVSVDLSAVGQDGGGAVAVVVETGKG